MGGSLSSIHNIISRIDVSKSSSEDDQSVVYSTYDSRTCTLRTVVRAQTSIFTLRDYTFDNEGTSVEVNVRNQGGGVDTINLAYGGSTLEAYSNAGRFNIVYGHPQERCAALHVGKYHTDTHGDALFVTHLYNIGGQKFFVHVFIVWYDVVKGRFMCTLTGPSQHSSPVEALVAMKKAFPSSDADDSTVGDDSNQTSITGLINNTHRPVYGHLNGSIVNFFNVYVNYK